MKRSILRALFRVQPGEGWRIGLLLLYSAAFGGGVISIGYRGVASALFISRLPADAIPYLFILPAIPVTLVLLLYSRIAARVSSRLLVPVSTVIMLTLCLVFRALLETESGNSFEVLASLYLFAEAIVSMIGIQIWAIAGQVFDARQARRLFLLVSGGGTVASIGAGFLLGPLAGLLGVNNLLFVTAFALAVCGVSAGALGRFQPEGQKGVTLTESVKDKEDDAEARSFVKTLRAIWRIPLLRAIGALVVLLSVIINIGGYQLFRTLHVNFANQGQALVSFLGLFEVWTGVFALAVQLLITPFIVRRFGLFVALLFLPVATLIASGTALAAGGALLSIALNRAINPVFRWTINDIAINLLYLPVPIGLRQRAKELFGGLYAIVFGLLGVLFLVNQTNDISSYLYWSIPSMGVALLWIGLVPWARRQYLRRLGENVAQRRFDLRGAPLEVTDADSVRVLRDALRDKDDLRVLHALELIVDAPGADWDRHVAPLLSHTSPDVQVRAIRYLGRPGNEHYAAAIAALFDTPEESVIAAAIEAYCAITGADALELISPYLQDEGRESGKAGSTTQAAPAVQGAAVLGLMRFGGPQGASRATIALEQMAHSDDTPSRQEAARLLVSVARPELQSLMVALMDDRDPTVRVRAVQGLGVLKDVSMIPLLLSKLGDKYAGSAAIDALAGYGTEVLPGLETLETNPQSEDIVRSQAAKLLARIGSRQAARILLDRLEERDAPVRTAIFRALADIACRKPIKPLPEAQLEAQTIAELQAAYKLYVMRAVLEEAEQWSLLGEALTARLEGALDRVLDLLTVRYGARIQPVRAAITSSDSARRAQAIELLDNTLTTSVRDRLIPLIEAPADQVIAFAQKRFSLARRPRAELLAELAEGGDRWLSLCAIWRSGKPVHSGTVPTQTVIYPHGALSSGDGEHMAISTVERVLVLKRVALFAGISGEGLAPIAQLANEVRFNKGDTIIREGDPGDCVYITIDGQTGITRAGMGQVAVRDAPTVLGELALILSQPRSAGCVALTDIVALKIDRAPFQELLSQQPDIAKGVIKVLAEQLAQAQKAAHNQNEAQS